MEALIKIRHLKKTFGTKEILKDINLDIVEGSCTAILGFSGGGKSTIIKHIVGLLKPTSGEIWYQNKDITKLNNNTLREVRKDIGYLFQSGALFDSMNVFDNVAFPLREHTNLNEFEIKDKVMHYLEMVGLDANRVAYLEKNELSGGMQKRVGLARTIILDPKIILYDEPTSGLDPVTSDLISQMIISLQEKIKATSILISHDIKEIFKTANYFAMLYDGRIVEYGDETKFKSSDVEIVHKFLDGDSSGLF
jgi:phospholipid/cholesterol/gamma-HCH transport system ATP-binding protein